tara:strand:- start:2845 stop:4479 length:1635 start_codon:yes stop_codon:yes gene_type:complete
VTVSDDIALIRSALAEHNQRWDKERGLMRRLRALYDCEFWSQHKGDLFGEHSIRVETSDAYSYVEAYVASLFTRSPSVVVAHDSSAIGDAEITGAVVNAWLHRQRAELERATRLALIYPWAALKLTPQDSDDLINRVSLRAVAPWECIVDLDAERWSDCRFVGHTTYIPLAEARRLYGPRDYTPVAKSFYFQPSGSSPSGSPRPGEVPASHLYINVVELWDMEAGRFLAWSPDLADGQKLLKRIDIPLADYDGRPIPTMAPLFYATKPDRPLEGYSTLSRVYDQMVEKNIMRSFLANAVRRDSRQFIARKDAFNAEEMSKLTSGIDGAIAETESTDPLGALLQAVPKPGISLDFDRYLAQIDGDLNRASLLAPFVKGEATKATATEVTALAQYSASEIGRLARERDGAIEHIANIYIRMVYLLAEEGERAVVAVDGSPRVVRPADLDGRFRYVALDQASTPLSSALKRQQVLALLPALQTVGVPLDAVRRYLVREFDLPEDFDAPEPPASDPGRIRSAPDSVVPSPTGLSDAELLAMKLQQGIG